MSTRTSAQTKRSLREKLIRLAYTHPEKRASISPVLANLGVKLSKGDKMPPELLEKFKEDKKAGVTDKHQLKILKDTVKNPAKGFLGGPSATEAEKTLRTKFHFTDKQIANLKKASAGKVAVKPETEDFTRWVMSTQPPMSPNEIETFINRTLGIKTSPPVKRRGGDRFQRGDSVIIKAKKHKAAKFDRGNYDLYDGKIGTVTETNGMDALVSFKGQPSVRFPGALASRGVGIYKYSKPYTITGSAKIEMIYNAGGKATKDQKMFVEIYLGRGGRTETRSANYYTGHVIFASQGKKGFYFRGFPQQRMEVDPDSEAGYSARTFNPSLGQVVYLGVFNSRPARWKAELAKLDQAASEEE